MSLRVRQLRLVAETSAGTFGRELEFPDGLILIRADNTRGKSTVMQSIIYALGLESMVDPRHVVPLPPAMTDTLRDSKDEEHHVSESYVVLEIENGEGKRLTCQRWVAHERMDRHLIRTWSGGALSGPSNAYEQDDYFVRRPGAAVSERGFHHMLAEFLKWDLPMLARDEDTEVPLYLEMIFPLFFVEQKRGWGGIQATMPTYGIPNAKQRAIEFVLDLGVYRRARERRDLAAEIERLRGDYRQTLAEFRGRLEGTGIVLQGLDKEMPTSWPAVEPTLMSVVEENRWIALSELLQPLHERHRSLVEEEVPTAEEASRELEETLRENERLIGTLTAAASELRQNIELDEDQLASLEHRIEALEEDRRRYRDAITLKDLGSDEVSILEGDECPACHRPLPLALIAPESPPPMSLEQNIDFIAEQIRTFKLMSSDTEQHRDIESQRLAALRSRIEEVRHAIRAARATLVSPSKSPSVAAVRELLRLEDRITTLGEINQSFVGLLEKLRPIIEEATRVRARLLELPKERLDAEDEAKLAAFEPRIVSQLKDYGFRSFSVDTIAISRDNYLPTREGFDLGFVTSASDAIRIVWSYLLGLLEVSRDYATNHPGLLMFDEPRQQAADPVSFQALLCRAADVNRFGQQVLFATSEPEESLHEFLAGKDYTEITFEGFALEPLPKT